MLTEEQIDAMVTAMSEGLRDVGVALTGDNIRGLAFMYGAKKAIKDGLLAATDA